MPSSFSDAPLFEEFFASGQEESASPFLTPSSRRWAQNLPLKAALVSAFFLAGAYLFSFVYPPLSPLLLLFVYFILGTQALIDTAQDLRKKELNIDVLMTLAALLSVLIGNSMEGALLLVLFELSAAMEKAVTQKSKGALFHLHEYSPRTAYVMEKKGSFTLRSIKDVPEGAHILVKAGEIIPLDGKILKGNSFINLVHLTGESAPLARGPGDEVQAGARNLDGSLTLEVLRSSAHSTLTRIIQLITEAQKTKPQLQSFLDRIDKKYATSIMILAAAFGMFLPFFFPIPYLGKEGALYRALTFLVAASPCALIIATPTAYLCAITSSARKGILLKGGAILDKLAACGKIAFDKTGTLTTGKLTCSDVQCIEKEAPCDLKTAIGIAAGLEQHAVHPIAEALITYAQKKEISPLEIHHFQAKAGFGVEGVVFLPGSASPTPVAIGHGEYIASKKGPSLKEDKRTFSRKGYLHTTLLVGQKRFIFYFTDTVRREAAPVLKALSTKNKLELIMLTGDHQENGALIAKELGIPSVFADLRPEDKLQKVAELAQDQGLIMVGDGINDAPALTRATVGISMGKVGSATAIDASDVVFLNDDLSLLEWLLAKAHATRRIVKQNLTLALAVILFATTPALLGWVPLWIAVILHEGGTLLVGLNSLRLLHAKIKR